jgi:hypothetical protein
MKNSDAAKFTPEKVEKVFDDLRKAENYSTLGHIFFRLFIVLNVDNPARVKAAELWGSMSDIEKAATRPNPNR